RVNHRHGCGVQGIARCGFDCHGTGPYARTSSKMVAHARVTFLSALLPSPGGGGSTPSACEASGWGENYAAFTPPRLASLVDPPPPGEGKGRKLRRSLRQQHGVDDVDHAVRLENVGDRDHRDVTLVVGDGEFAGTGLLHDNPIAGDGLELGFTFAVLDGFHQAA